MKGGNAPSEAASPVRDYLLDLQDRVCGALEAVDGTARFREDRFEESGLARARVMEDGPVIEKAAVNFTHSAGDRLPEAATAGRSELAGGSFDVVSLSLIVHPRNPYAPTSHMNLRLFAARPADRDPVWWFGGGFDLTPYYGFVEDAVAWHRAARSVCARFGDDVYPRMKRACDEYFSLPHRGEARGVGGLFFDDLNEWGFERTFAFVRAVGDGYLPAYLPLVERRKNTPYGDRERNFQLYRRGRYVEFNLLYDRGTRYGIQSGRRIESTLASMPPLVAWRYAPEFPPGSPEARLVEDFLEPRDWLGESD